jgi:mutator protein MutT
VVYRQEAAVSGLPAARRLRRLSVRSFVTVPHIVVTAAVIERDGTFLLTRRLRGTHLEGAWEFPGGKCEPGETHPQCLEREIREELNAALRIGREICSITHPYAQQVVELHFFACDLLGEPRPMIGQEMRWVPRAELKSLEFPAADAELIRMLSDGRA